MSLGAVRATLNSRRLSWPTVGQLALLDEMKLALPWRTLGLGQQQRYVTMRALPAKKPSADEQRCKLQTA